MSEVQVVYLGIDEIYALEELIEGVDLTDEDIDEGTRESLEIASSQLYQSRHYRNHYDASCFAKLNFEERESLEKLLNGSEFLIPKNSLWQYLTKDYLDEDNKLTDEKWETFVSEYGDGFAEGCADLGHNLLSCFLDNQTN
tara:strand:+ start:148 stop:570 length:423 start_codon:yes stop_codon:yes gene_type:complete